MLLRVYLCNPASKSYLDYGAVHKSCNSVFTYHMFNTILSVSLNTNNSIVNKFDCSNSFVGVHI